MEAIPLVTHGASFDHASVSQLIPVVAQITGAVDRLHIAEVAAATVLSAESATPHVLLCVNWGLALIAVLRGDVEAAEKNYSALKSCAGIQLIGLNSDRLLGMVAQTTGEFDKSAEHFEDSLAFCRKAGYRPELASSCCDYADLLLERNNDGDRATAMSLLDESLAISTELGMRPLMERVLARQVKLAH